MEGPHALARRHDGQNNGATSQLSSYSVGMWIIRLHLAQYCITGKYPTWFHRFAGLTTGEVRDNVNNNNKSTKSEIPCQPSTYRSVGLLIFTQAAVSFSQNASKYVCRKIVDQLEKQKLSASSVKSHKQQFVLFPPSRNNSSSTVVQDDGTTPSIIPTTAVATSAHCTICRMDRTHPAAPSTCGHVCCWACLTQWVSTVRPECPLCRSPCKPQDVIALHDYDLPLNSE